MIGHTAIQPLLFEFDSDLARILLCMRWFFWSTKSLICASSPLLVNLVC